MRNFLRGIIQNTRQLIFPTSRMIFRSLIFVFQITECVFYFTATFCKKRQEIQTKFVTFFHHLARHLRGILPQARASRFWSATNGIFMRTGLAFMRILRQLISFAKLKAILKLS